MYSKRSIVFIMAIVLCSLTSCNLKVIPIQMARVVQIDSYKQYYKFRDAEHARNVLQQVVGEKNWKIIEDHYLLGDMVQDMLDGRFVIEGYLIFTLSLDPNNFDQFYVQGMGKYHVHRKTTNEIILSADYTILNQQSYSLKSVNEKGYLELQVKRYYTRYFAPDERNYLHDIPLTFRLKVKELKKEGIYTLDYDSKHTVLIGNEVAGEIEFSGPTRHQIIDLRGLDKLREDY